MDPNSARMYAMAKELGIILDRIENAKSFEDVEMYLNHKLSEVRVALANKGYGLEQLVHDKDVNVCMAVAKYGYRLDILINHKYHRVRMIVAEHGYGLDKLINDKNSYVRAKVAEQGYRLDKLVHDENWEVRLEVARQGYRLDILKNDENRTIATLAKGLEGATTYIISRNSGFHKNILLRLHIWEDKYEICNDWYKVDSLKKWEELYSHTSKDGKIYAEIMRDIIEKGDEHNG